MKIDAKRQSLEGQSSSSLAKPSDLLKILSNRPKVRPCGACTRQCSAHRSTECLCECSPTCPEAPKLLSSEPLQYPIESKILPLVYALAADQIFQPCWSCEGHLGPDGSLHKLPAVWFYAPNAASVDVFSNYLSMAKTGLRLSHTWHLVVTFGVNDIAFSCTPDAWLLDNADLSALHLDIEKLANDISRGFSRQAEKVAAQSSALQPSVYKP